MFALVFVLFLFFIYLNIFVSLFAKEWGNYYVLQYYSLFCFFCGIIKTEDRASLFDLNKKVFVYQYLSFTFEVSFLPNPASRNLGSFVFHFCICLFIHLYYAYLFVLLFVLEASLLQTPASRSPGRFFSLFFLHLLFNYLSS